MISGKALGLIETKGLIGAIEACDAAAKAAAVIVSSAELTEAAFLTIKIEGDLGAVQAAVEAGAAAAEKIGELVSVHVIPNPDSGLSVILPNRRFISKYHPDDTRPALGDDDAEPNLPVKPKPSPPATPTSSSSPRKKPAQDLNKMTVSELRKLARTIKNFPLQGREISKANKTLLINEIKKSSDKKQD